MDQMKRSKETSIADRQSAAAAAKKAALERHRAMATDPLHAERLAARQAVSRARDARVAARKASRLASEAREAAERATAEAAAQAAREAVARAECHSGSAWNAFHFFSRSASDSHCRK